MSLWLHAAILIIFLSSTLLAEKGSIIGIVTDSKDGEPLSAACVRLFDPDDTKPVDVSTTDLIGMYRLKGVEAGDYYIEVTYIGYNTKKTDYFRVESDSAVEMNISLDAYEIKSSGIIAADMSSWNSAPRYLIATRVVTDCYPEEECPSCNYLVFVEWGRVAQSDGYNLYRATVRAGEPCPTRPDEPFISIDSYMRRNFIENGISDENVYYYWICAVKDGIEGDFIGPELAR